MRRLLVGLAAGLAGVAAAAWWCDRAVESAAEGRVYASVDEVPARPVGLVLGTASKVADGRDNLFFRYRVQAAAALYKAGKIRHVLVSGDNGRKTYDEATDMRNALVALGIPERAISRDHAGFRTLDSVVRCKQVFGQPAVIIISQRFHAERALYIARGHGMDAVAFGARDVAVSASPWTYGREWLARVMAVLDLRILRRGPRFGGPAERIKTG